MKKSSKVVEDETLEELQEKLRGVSEKFLAEFTMGASGVNENRGPAPNMHARELLFDSMQTIIREGSGDDSGGVKDKELARHVYVCGAGYHAQLGRKIVRGEKKYATVPQPVSMEAPIRQLSCGALHSAVVTDEGEVLTWGDNSHGQLGHGGATCAMWPTPKAVFIEGGPVHSVACGQYHCMALTKSDECYGWGWGKFGQLGLGNRVTTKSIASLVCCDDPDFRELKQVSCGDKHTCFVTKAGRIFTCGLGDQGQLGHGLNDNGQLSQQELKPRRVEFFEDMRVVQADCGSITTAAVTDEGKVYIWGFGEQLYGAGQPNFQPLPVLLDFKHKVVQVACGQSHMLLLTDTGDVYGWGGGEYGEIGQGANKSQFKPVLVIMGKGVRQVACGRYHSAALTKHGILYMWGCGDNGQLGRPEGGQDSFVKQASSVPKVVNSITGNVVGMVSCGEQHTCVIASCRYVELPDQLQQWGTLEEMEFEFKLGIASRHRGKGIPRRDILAIRRWRREEEAKRERKTKKDEQREEIRAAREVEKILSGDEIREHLTSPENRNKRRKSGEGQAVSSRSRRQRERTTFEEMPVARRSRKKKDVDMRVTEKQTNAARAGFHTNATQLLEKFGQTLYDFQNPKIDGVQYTREDMIKRKFAFRKKFDKLHLVTKKKKAQLRELEEEWKLLEETKEHSKDDSLHQNAALHKLRLQLNTITIKINEAERNRETYELNISNIKDEGQETTKKLDHVRQQFLHQENLQKKVEKFGKYAGQQKETAVTSVKDFKSELGDWRNFLQLIIASMGDLAKGKKERDSQQRKQLMKKQDDIKRSKTLKKIEEVLEKVDKKEEERMIQSEIRRDLEDTIKSLKFVFDKVKRATNKEDPQDIIVKYSLNSEVKQEYESIRDVKLTRKEELEKEYDNLTAVFMEMTSSKIDHTWREVDALQENLEHLETVLKRTTTDVSTIASALEQLKVWMTSIISKYDIYLDEWDGVDDRITQAERDDVDGVLMALQSRIKTFRQIIQHQVHGTETTVFTKKQQ